MTRQRTARQLSTSVVKSLKSELASRLVSMKRLARDENYKNGISNNLADARDGLSSLFGVPTNTTINVYVHRAQEFQEIHQNRPIAGTCRLNRIDLRVQAGLELSRLKGHRIPRIHSLSSLLPPQIVVPFLCGSTRELLSILNRTSTGGRRPYEGCCSITRRDSFPLQNWTKSNSFKGKISFVPIRNLSFRSITLSSTTVKSVSLVS